MLITLRREPSSDGCTIGRLFVDGRSECWTLEDVERPVKVAGQTAIPAGRYDVTITLSQRFGRMLPLLANVPNFTGIRIHAGNTAADTEGCILVGQQRGLRSIQQSALALAHLQPQIAGALARGERVEIEVSGAAPRGGTPK